MKHLRSCLPVSLVALIASSLGACLDTSAGQVAGVPEVAPADRFVEVRVGAVGTCVRTTSGRVTCTSTRPEGTSFVVVESGASELAAAGTVIWHLELMACAIADDEIVCANGERRYRFALPGAHALTIGDFTACVLDGDAHIWCWSPLDGQGDAAPPLVAGPVIADVTALASSAYGTCALDERGAVRCWGASHGAEPEAVLLPEPARAISAGINHTCAWLASGGATCWSGVDDEPAPPAGAIAWLDAGGFATCIIEAGTGYVRCRSSGTEYAWSLGELLQIDVGAAGVCGITAEGAVVCAPGE